jgi:hypothetical protein
MLVDYTTVLDRPSVSVESLTQQGIESIVEVTPASSITSDGSSDPSLQIWLPLRLHLLLRRGGRVLLLLLLLLASALLLLLQATMQSL